MNVIFILPTGIGCEIGGHAGDATPSAKLLAATCDNMIIHPNVVNASDINEMSSNMWYTEGSILDRFIQGQIALEAVYSNKILLAVNKPVKNETINSVNASKHTIGAEIDIIVLETPLTLKGVFGPDGKATGIMDGHKEACLQIHKHRQHYPFDVLAIQTVIDVDRETSLRYTREKGVNPWGGAEAVCSRFFSRELGIQSAHAPFESGVFKKFNKVVDARLAAEFVSISYIHCIFKGLHMAPKIVDYSSSSKDTIRIDDIDVMVSPDGCWGTPHEACADWGIPIIFVEENKNIYKPHEVLPKNCYKVNDYMKASGLISSMKAGVSIESIMRPVKETKIYYANKH